MALTLTNRMMGLQAAIDAVGTRHLRENIVVDGQKQIPSVGLRRLSTEAACRKQSARSHWQESASAEPSKDALAPIGPLELKPENCEEEDITG